VLAASALAVAAAAGADLVVLTNGRVIEAERAWYEGDQVRYQKNGGTFGLPRSLVKTIETQGAGPVADPDLARGQALLAAGSASAAVDVFLGVLARTPTLVPAFQGLAQAHVARKDGHSAKDAASRAVALDGRNALSHALLGDALALLGDRAGAESAYRRSLLLKPDPVVERKASALGAAPSSSGPRAQFRIRYDGGANETLGQVVLEVLSGAYEDFARRLGFRPQDPINVVLEMGTGIQDGVPEWAAGVNDGTIRVPLRGIEQPTPRLVAVLRHELAHSFIAARTGGNCPTWLQEGISQWLEGGDPHRDDATVAAAVRGGRLLPLLTLEGPFQALPPESVTLAYAESLSAVAHIVKTRSPAAIVRLLAGLGDGLPAEEALPAALALSYPEFQSNWESSLRTVGRAGR
jgi:tetratricopeptide (TPR) repeat protein